MRWSSKSRQVRNAKEKSQPIARRADTERLEIQAESLRVRVRALEGKVGELDAEVFALRAKVDSLQSHKRAVWWRLWT